MRVQLVSTYELGHQPLQLASAAAWLRNAGYEVTCIDLAVQALDIYLMAQADAIAISVPMHTASRLALRLVGQLRAAGINAPIALYGLYANVASYSADNPATASAPTGVDAFFSGEYHPALTGWVDEIAKGIHGSRCRQGVASICEPVNHTVSNHYLDTPESNPMKGGITSQARRRQVSLNIKRHDSLVPDRNGLAPLKRYARLRVGDEERLAGYVEATRGCSHRCLHCPVPTVYDGRIRKVGVDTVLADVEHLVDAGAKHITFGDPDFLNAPGYAMEVVRELHAAFTHLTFDATIKVEHIVKYPMLFPNLAQAGCLFVVSAFESASDVILGKLMKGHTYRDMETATGILRSCSIEPRVSLVPFTPWTTPDDIIDLLDMAAVFDLIPNIDTVQWSIRLLVPPGSLLLDTPANSDVFGTLDAEHLGHTWQSAYPVLDDLQVELDNLASKAALQGIDAAYAYTLIRERALEMLYTSHMTHLPHPSPGTEKVASAGRWHDPAKDIPSPAAHLRSPIPAEMRPSLTEAWFCCAEPTSFQVDQVNCDTRC
ncbi:MAG: radical SAM protein [Actinobacteria bacterium]|nr:radical SAM protein [Actinomycetota bacterium]MCL5445822.1 radical SAM protein [Actinomycetota bacterium]